MNSTYAQSLARARTALAELADTAANLDASSAYKHVLIYLDLLHSDGPEPALEPKPMSDREAVPTALHDVAITAINRLQHSPTEALDPLDGELLLALVEQARLLESR